MSTLTGRRRVEYPASMVAKARSLAEGGWRPAQIRRLLADEHERVPTLSTVIHWVDETEARKHRDAQRNIMRKAGAKGSLRLPQNRSSVWRMARMRALRDAGLSHQAVATVMSFDFPDFPVTRREVERALDMGRPPRSWRDGVAA